MLLNLTLLCIGFTFFLFLLLFIIFKKRLDGIENILIQALLQRNHILTEIVTKLKELKRD